jgi:LmbE family N-acetylglucosaminyl deacetylase
VPDPLTLMAVHAHPDDEALFTGGILARYGAEGVRTVVVTCTNGELGDPPDGVGSLNDPTNTVVAQRRQDLENSCAALGVGHLELLGYHDSGMMGWPQNEAPGVFWQTDVDAATDRLAALIEQYRPEVVVTYGADGFYGHPDHIQTHRITVAAVDRTGIPEKLYFVALPKSALDGFVELAKAESLELPEWVEGDPPFGTDDELVTTYVDCSAVVGNKFEALAAHASQRDNAFFLELGTELFGAIFSIEAFVRGLDHTGAPTPEDDLFAGLRGPGPA